MKKFNYYLILAIVFLLPSYLVRFNILGIPTTMLEMLIYLAAIITFLTYGLRFTLTGKKIIAPISLLIIAGIIGILVSPDKMTALGQFKAYIFDPILFFWILRANVKDADDIKQILYAFVASGIYVSIQAFWQYFTGKITSDGRIVGIFGYSPNYLAFYMVPLTVIAAFLFWKDINKKIIFNILKIILMILFVGAVVLTGSRAAIIALIGAVCLGFFIKYLYYSKQAKTIKIVLGIVVALLIVVGGYFFVRPDFSLDSNEAGRIGSSNNIRWEIWKTTTEDIIFKDENWLTGIGLGNYQKYFTELTIERINYPEWISPKALTAHNIFLSTWVNLGIFGLFAFIWLLYLFFKNVKLKNYFSFAVFVAMITVLIQGLVDTPYWKNDLAVMFWLLIFIALFQISDEKKAR